MNRLGLLLMWLPFVGIANPKPRLSVSGSEVTGTYRLRDNVFKIQALGKGKLKIHFYGQYKGLTPESVNVGEAEGIATIQADSVAFQPSQTDGACVIRLKFLRGNRLVAYQPLNDGGKCGMGHNVSATGTYRKISNKRPRFTTDRPL